MTSEICVTLSQLGITNFLNHKKRDVGFFISLVRLNHGQGMFFV
jgi:hypothetical protein